MLEVLEGIFSETPLPQGSFWYTLNQTKAGDPTYILRYLRVLASISCPNMREFR